MIATVRAYLSANGRIVHEGDPAAAFLLCGVGQTVPAEHAEAYAAFAGEPKAETDASPAVLQKAERPAENKAITKPPANKKRR